LRGIIEVGMDDGRRMIYRDGNRLHLAVRGDSMGGVVRTRRVKSIEFVPLDDLEGIRYNGGLLEKDIVYIDGSFEWQRGVVIGKMGSTLFVRKRDLFDGTDLDRKERVPIENVVGVVKDRHEES